MVGLTIVVLKGNAGGALVLGSNHAIDAANALRCFGQGSDEVSGIVEHGFGSAVVNCNDVGISVKLNR